MAASMMQSRPVGARGFKQDLATFEQEQDANSALSDLDRGLRSLKVGVQCESVVRFPRLFEKYPFPILINSAFLRLADVFRAGNNFIRWCILRITEQSEKHLDKILNVEEFMRRIFTVYHSNDPIARAVTLRTLGSISVIIAERKNIHHSVGVSLDSHDAVEVEAAIFAARKFSEQSRSFAANICDKIAEMINNIATPVELKLALIPILKHMHHDVTLAAKAKGICMSLLSSYPAQKFAILTLQTMSHLASLSLVDIQPQVSLLLDKLEEDHRRAVKIVALQEMRKLAKKTPHLWTYTQALSLCGFVQRTPYVGLKVGALSVLTVLSRSVAFQIFLAKHDLDSSFLDVCNLCYQYDNATLVSKATEFYTYLAIAYNNTKGTEWWGGQSLVEGAMLSLQTQIALGASQTELHEQEALKLCLHCAVELAKSHPKTAEIFLSSIAGLLKHNQGGNQSLLCECLAAIGDVYPGILHAALVPQLLSILRESNTSEQEPQQFQVYLCTVLFQAAEGKTVPDHVRDDVLTCTGQSSPWLGYKIARQALRYGQYNIAGSVFSSLALKVSSEHFYFWLISLRDISSGENCLHQPNINFTNIIPHIGDALTHYQKGLTSIKAASTPSFQLHFQCEYVFLRASLLEIHTQLIRTCNTFRTCPPPAIASALAITHGQEITRCGQIVNQLGKCANDYDELSTRVAYLYQQSFDSDQDSLDNVQLLQLCCEVMKLAITSITLSGQEGQALLADKLVFSVVADEKVKDRLSQQLHSINHELAVLLQTEGSATISYKHMEFLSNSVAKLATTTNSFPRYFFQSLQQTSLKLAISPQQSSLLEPVLVQHNTYLTLKVEGVIQHGFQPGLLRTIKGVIITVLSNLHSPTGHTDVKVTESTVNELTQQVKPHHDYFSTSFLLGFQVTGLHVVNIEAAIVDDAGTTWKTGPKVSLQVKSYDDTVQRQQSKHSSRSGYSQLLNS